MHKLRKAVNEGVSPEPDDPIVMKRAARPLGQKRLSGDTILRKTRRQSHQRNERRYPVAGLEVRATWRNETTELRIVNLSSNGIQVATEREAEINETIDIVLGECAPVECAVRWIKDDQIGLEFSPETRLLTEAGVVNYVLENISQVLRVTGRSDDGALAVERRGPAMRHGLTWLAALTIADKTVPVMLRNISRTGTMLHLDEPIQSQSGAACVLDLGNAGTQSATIMWSAGEEAGLAFDEPFDVSALTNHAAAEANALNAVDSLYDEGEEVEEANGDWVGSTWYSSSSDGDESPAAAQKSTASAQIGPPSLKELYETMYPDGIPVESSGYEEPEPDEPQDD